MIRIEPAECHLVSRRRTFALPRPTERKSSRANLDRRGRLNLMKQCRTSRLEIFLAQRISRKNLAAGKNLDAGRVHG